MLGRAFEELEELHDQGKIPNTTIPVLQDRLSAEICICGETLEAGRCRRRHKRRAHIQKLIDDSERADEIQEIITDLYYGAKPLQGGPQAQRVASSWLEDYRKVVERRDGIQALRDEAGRKVSGAGECILDSLPDTISRDFRERAASTRTSVIATCRNSRLSKPSLSGLRRERQELEAERDRLLREQTEGARAFWRNWKSRRT